MTALPSPFSVEATKARINLYCELFDMQPPKLRTRLDKVYMTDELLEWCREAGASIDWICCGDPISMICRFRRVSMIEAPNKTPQA